MLKSLNLPHIGLYVSPRLMVILLVFGLFRYTVALEDRPAPLVASEPAAYTLTIVVAGLGNGTVISAPNQITYTYGTVVTLTATPAANSFFAGWSGDVISTSNPLTVTMIANVALTATFTLSTRVYFPLMEHYATQQGQTGGVIYAVAAQDNYIYIGQGTKLVVFDRTNPAALVQVGQSEPMPGVVEGLTIAGHYAYVADGAKGGLRILDISHPPQPVEVGAYATAGYAREVVVAGNYAYVARITIDGASSDSGGGVSIIDVSNPAAAHEVGRVGSEAMGLAVAGPYVYFVNASHYPCGGAIPCSSKLDVADVRDPAQPIAVGQFYIPDSDFTHLVWDVTVAGNYAFVSDDQGLAVIDVSQPVTPTLASYYDDPFVRAAVISGTHAYLADGTGLAVVDVSQPQQPVEIGRYNTPAHGYGLALAENEALVVTYDTRPRPFSIQSSSPTSGGLYVVGISTPQTPGGLGQYQAGKATQVVGAGQYAYVVEAGNGLRIVNIGDLVHPAQMGIYTSPTARAVAVAGRYAYLVNANGLQIVDVGNPKQPIQVGSLALPDTTQIVLIGQYAYLVQGGSVKIVDISNPHVPTEAGTLDVGDNASVAIWGNYTYVFVYEGSLFQSSYLKIWDVSNPKDPIRVSPDFLIGYWTPIVASIWQNMVYVLPWNTPTIINAYDSSAITQLVSAGSLTVAAANKLMAWGNYLYTYEIPAASSDPSFQLDAFLWMYRVADPAHSTPLTSLHLPSYLQGLDVKPGCLYLADGEAGLVIVPWNTTN